MSSPQQRYSHMQGNEYAKKYDRVLDATLSLRCNFSDKCVWGLQAQSEGKSLNQWVIEQLNLAANIIE